MKVICAGLSKTGTKTMNAALTALGYKVYDYLEHFEILGEKWFEIFNTDGDKTEKIRAMYKDVDAVCDVPVNGYWEDFMKAFPDAKVVLMVRNDPDVWLQSILGQVRTMNATLMPMLTYLYSPTMRKFMNFNANSVRPTFGYVENNLMQNFQSPPDILLKIFYKQHNAYVKQVCPSEKLLIFNCTEGWDPLCKFLQLPTPTSPFPHKNIKGSITEEIFLPSATFQKIRREVAVRLGITFSLIGLGIWRLFQKGISPSYCWGAITDMLPYGQK